MKRQRGRSRRSGGSSSNNLNRHYESNGPDVKIRGTAQQILDKYLQYARDAQTSGDRVSSEAYFQHAEHYQRLIASMQPKEKRRNPDEESEEEAQSSNAETPRSDSRDSGEGSKDKTPEPERAAGADSGSDALRVIDGDGEGEESGKDKAEAEADADAGEAKPKRRRTYRRKTSEDKPADVADDGLAKTLARGAESESASAAAE